MRIKVCATVRCRLFNSVERVSYGDSWIGQVVKIHADGFEVTKPGYTNIKLKRKEIKEVLR